MLRRTRLRLVLVAVVLAQWVSVAGAQAQARDTVASLRTHYNTAKTQANPQGDLKAKFDVIRP